MEKPSQRLTLGLFLQNTTGGPALLKDTFYVHFSLKVKPWQPAYSRRVMPLMTVEYKSLIHEWQLAAREVCAMPDRVSGTGELRFAQ